MPAGLILLFFLPQFAFCMCMCVCVCMSTYVTTHVEI